MIFAVTFQQQDNTEVVSRFFTTIRAARKWAKWLASNEWTQSVRILRGGPGGEPVQ